MNTPLAAYEGLAWHLIGGLVFLLFTTWLSKRLSRSAKHALLSPTYECGEEPTKGASAQFQLNYHITALVFLLFEVELLFLFPWAVAASHPPLPLWSPLQWAYWLSGEMFVFLGILGLGLLYIWKKGALRPYSAALPIPKPKVSFSVPSHYYEKFNQKYQSTSAAQKP